MEEEWLPVKGYEGLYEVSNMGRVRSLKNTRHVIRKEPLIKKQFVGSWGYPMVALCKDGISKPSLVHRLVAEAFVPNPDNLPFINHKDENRQNSVSTNLEFCTQAYNNNYGTARQRGIETAKKNGSYNTKKLYQYDKIGNLIGVFDSVASASKSLNINASTLSNCANGKRHCRSAHGYVFRFTEWDCGATPRRNA